MVTFLTRQAEMERIGYVNVDSGTLMISDPCYVLHSEHDNSEVIGNSWGEFCGLILDQIQGNGEGVEFGDGMGVCVSTTYGDGTYPVFAVKTKNRVSGIYIDFEQEVEDGE